MYINQLPEITILDTRVSLTNKNSTLDLIKNYNFNKCHFISLGGLYMILKSYENKVLQSAINSSLINPIHGKSIEIIARILGYKDLGTVDGVFLLNNLLKENFTHYFYGTNSSTLEKIKNKIELEFPNAKVLGYSAAPIISLDNISNNKKIEKDIMQIKRKKPDIIWIGLGGEKQTLLMYDYHEKLGYGLMVGVGAVFDYFAGKIKLSPPWVKKMGLRWLYRLVQQPWLIKKYLQIIPICFIAIVDSLFKK